MPHAPHMHAACPAYACRMPHACMRACVCCNCAACVHVHACVGDVGDVGAEGSEGSADLNRAIHGVFEAHNARRAHVEDQQLSDMTAIRRFFGLPPLPAKEPEK